MTIQESLQGINAYPVPSRALVTIMTKRGLTPGDEVTQDTLVDFSFNLARADVLYWLSMAPNVSQGGQTYSFKKEERDRMRAEAISLYDEYEDTGAEAGRVRFGYKGDRL